MTFQGYASVEAGGYVSGTTTGDKREGKEFKTMNTLIVNETDLGSTQLSKILDYIVSIYNDSGFDGIFSFNIVSSVDAKKAYRDSYDLFLAFVDDSLN